MKHSSKQMRIGHAIMFVLLCIAALCLAGCAGTTPPPKPSMPSMNLSPGDEIEIKFAYAEQLNELQMIRPDGKIELLLVGEVTAEGKTPSQLRAELEKLYIPHIKHPQLAVIVRSFRGRRIYVGGEVARTGYIDMPGPMTLLEAIMQVGGFREETADLEEIVIIRHNEGKRFTYLVNLRSSTKGKGQHEPMHYLEPRDIVLVPQKDVINVNQWVDHYIRKNLPFSVGASTFVAPQSAQ